MYRSVFIYYALSHDFLQIRGCEGYGTIRSASLIKSVVPKGAKVNMVRYADDILVTGVSKKLLEDNVVPVISGFLKERGLELSKEKTKIIRIEDGFNFLGQHLQKHGNKLIITPSKDATKALVANIKAKAMCMKIRPTMMIPKF
jgi:RNA-directed DNA polymerase